MRVAVLPRRLLAMLVIAVLLAACGGAQADDGNPSAADEAGGEAKTTPLTVYSGRSEELVGPLLEEFEEATGFPAEVRYGDTAELAATILEEGDSSPADVFFAQDAGALGALQDAGVLAALPQETLDTVDERFASGEGSWVGVSGRARVLVYNTESLTEGDVPDSVLDLTEEGWAGRVGWAPTNASFQAFVTAMLETLGDEVTRQWLTDMMANDVQTYANNSAIVDAVGRGEIALGLVNHYYLYQFLAEDPEFPAANAFLGDGDPGALVNVAGVGVLSTTDQPEVAQAFVEYLLSPDAQTYFASQTYEYPLAAGADPDERLPALSELDPPDLELSDLDDLQGTLEMLRETGALT